MPKAASKPEWDEQHQKLFIADTGEILGVIEGNPMTGYFFNTFGDKKGEGIKRYTSADKLAKAVEDVYTVSVPFTETPSSATPV